MSGLQAASLRLDAAASNIVNGSSPTYQPVSVSQSLSRGGGVRASLLAYDPAAPTAAMDLPAELVNLKLASHDFRASLIAYKTSAEIFKALLDATV